MKMNAYNNSIRETVHLLCTIDIPFAITDIINSFLFYPIDFGKHRKKMKKIVKKINYGYHCTLRDEEWVRRFVFCLSGYSSHWKIIQESQFQSSFCIKCGNFMEEHLIIDVPNCIKCKCIHNEYDIPYNFTEDDNISYEEYHHFYSLP